MNTYPKFCEHNRIEAQCTVCNRPERRALDRHQVAALPDDLRLLADVLDARAAGSFDTLLGNADEDLLGAIENVKDHLGEIELALTAA